MYYHTGDDQVGFYNGSEWVALGPSGVETTGGTRKSHMVDIIFIFLSPMDNLMYQDQVTGCEYVVVAGGGGGGL